MGSGEQSNHATTFSQPIVTLQLLRSHNTPSATFFMSVNDMNCSLAIPFSVILFLRLTRNMGLWTSKALVVLPCLDCLNYSTLSFVYGDET